LAAGLIGGGGIFGIGWGSFDAVVAVGVDEGMSAEEETADIGEDGGTTSGDAVGGEEPVEVTKGVVDALGGLETFPAGEELAGEIGGVGLFLDAEMARAEAEFGVGREVGTATAGGRAMGTASGDGDR
jgi:hypothetical protein